METQLLQLDTFLAGHITEEGDATQWLPESEIPERLQRYTDLCAKLVPNLTAAIHRQSQDNRDAEPKNQIHGYKNPEHLMSWEIFLAPGLVKVYGELVEELCEERNDYNPDMDPWTEPQKFSRLIDVINGIFKLQHDFDNWKHISPEPQFNQLLRPEGLEFQRIMRNPSHIRTYYCFKTPQGKRFWQHQIIPEVDEKIKEHEAAKIWQQKTRGSIYLLPDPRDVTVPRKNKDKTWAKSDGNGQTWTYGDEVWSLTLIFFAFDKKTNAYINYHIVPLELLDTVDLNDQAWIVACRRKIGQWRSRAAGDTATHRYPWSVEERAVAYAWANDYCKTLGIDQLETRIIDRNKKNILDAVNAAISGSRNAESVRAWIRNQMTKKPKEPLGILFAEHKRVARMINAGVEVPDEVRFPEEFIDIDKFKADERLKDHRNTSTNVDKKRKRDENDRSDPEENAANNSRNYDLDDDATQTADQGDDQEDDEQADSDIPRTLKRAKLNLKSKGKQ